MHSDIYSKKFKELDGLTLRGESEDSFMPKFKGEVLDYFIHKDGTKELIREIDYNIVVNNCSVLIAALMKGETGYFGATYWAVGVGQNDWAIDNPPSPSATDSQLSQETYRKSISASDIVYLNTDNTVSETPTNKIQITVIFDETEANGVPLMEFGIFGGNATSTANSGVMINHKTHPVIYKTSALKLERILRLTF